MTIMTLWLPIIVSAVIVFVAGAVIWMVMPWHKNGMETDTRRGIRSSRPQGLPARHVYGAER